MARKTRNQRNRASQAPPTSFFGRIQAALASRNNLLETGIWILAVLGMLVTFHLWIQQGRGFDQGCWGFNPPSGAETTFNCSVVVQSDAGQILGISNVYWGMGFYIVIGLLSFLMAGAGNGRRTRLHQVRTLLIGVGFLYSMYLVNYQLSSLGEMCALCLTSAGISTLLFLTQFGGLLFGKPSEPTEAKPAMGMYKIAIAALAVHALADYTYFHNLEIREEPAVAVAAPSASAVAGEGEAGSTLGECVYDQAIAPFPRYAELIFEDDPYQGNPDAPVKVIEIFDPNCPHCQLLHPVMKEAVALYGDQAQFFFKPFPLWSHSMTQIEAMYVAKERGLFFEMVDAQIAQRATRGLPMSTLRAIGDSLGIPSDLLNSRLRNQLYRSVMLEHREKIAETNLGGVPAVMINGRFIGTKNVECIGRFIEEAAGS